MTNKSKHSIALEETKTLWFVTAVEVEAKNLDELRSMMIGRINGKFYSCIYTLRNGVVRLISASRSRKLEEKIYYEHFEK